MMFRLPKNRTPVAPADILRHEFMEPLGLNAKQVSEAIHVPAARIHALLAGELELSPNLALRLSRYFSTSSGFWLGLQARYDLARASAEQREVLERITPLRRA